MKINFKLTNFNYFFICLFFCFVSLELHSQVVDIESQRFNKNQNGIFGEVNFDGSFTQNTTQVWQISNENKLLFQQSKFSALLFSDFGLVKGNKADLINRGFAHVRFNYHLNKSKKLTTEAFEQIQYNRIQGINLRQLVGAGLRQKIVGHDSLESFFGILGMYEFEQVKDQTTPNKDFRLSSYFSVDWLLTKSVSFNTIFYYQPLANKFSDFRATNRSTFIFNITQKWGFKLMFSYLTDSNPPVGIPKEIITIQNGLSLRF